MRIGNVVVLKKMSNIMGTVEAISDDDIVTISLCDTGIKVQVDIVDLECTGSTQPQRISGGKVSVLGTYYTISIIEEDDYRYKRYADGWCDFSVKEILVFNYQQSKYSVKDLVEYQKKVIRHEIVHAFLYESGLWQNSETHNNWAKNEEMVDWIAIQFPKLREAFKQAGAL